MKVVFKSSARYGVFYNPGVKSLSLISSVQSEEAGVIGDGASLGMVIAKDGCFIDLEFFGELNAPVKYPWPISDYTESVGDIEVEVKSQFLVNSMSLGDGLASCLIFNGSKLGEYVKIGNNNIYLMLGMDKELYGIFMPDVVLDVDSSAAIRWIDMMQDD